MSSKNKDESHEKQGKTEKEKADKFVPPEIKSNSASVVRGKADKEKASISPEAQNLKKQLDEAIAKIKELEEHVAATEEYKEEAARAKADFYNYRTRVERDRARDRVLAAEGTVDVLLPVLDNLDRTIDAVADKESPLCKGVCMVQRQFFGALQSLGLQLIDTACPFDPKEHEAMMMVNVDGEDEDGKILEVFHRGYKLGDKVLRAAQVKVGKKN